VADPRDFIDPDEGYRQTDWDSHLDSREPFFTQALPCESCGQPCDDRRPASWDPELLVGPCCELDLSQIPDMPVCEDLCKLLMRCATVGQVGDVFSTHRKVCRKCNPELGEIQEAA
jgi:hypothetical protein